LYSGEARRRLEREEQESKRGDEIERAKREDGVRERGNRRRGMYKYI
jgi:hypothetical protein